MKKIIILISTLICLYTPAYSVLAEEITPTLDTATSNTVDTATPSTAPDDDTHEDVTSLVQETSTPPPIQTETVLIRSGETIIYQGTVDLPGIGTTTITDDAGVEHTVNARSVLGFLSTLSQNSGVFTLSRIQYYETYNALYLKCIQSSDGVELCDNWQYVINTVTPYTGMDTTLLTGNETISLYFGSPHKVTLDKTVVAIDENVTTRAEKYNYIDNTWEPLTNVTIGITTPNATDPYNPTVVTTHLVDETGTARFSLSTIGTYTVGISEDYYFPSYTLTVVEANTSGGGTIVQIPSFNTAQALAYLASVQNPDGSFGSGALYTDWVAIAYGAVPGNSSSKNLILSYFKEHNTVSSYLTDNERHAMALLALNKNPYNFEGVNYITPIINAFDGTQFGDPNLINDDIFALFPLLRAGYTSTDSVISSDIVFILSKQKSNGSWEESPDMTAASMQILASVSSQPGVSDALTRAELYLKNLQQNDGGFGSIYSTSWVAQAMSAIGALWIKNNHTPMEYIATQQKTNGSMLAESETVQNNIWATSYAIPGVLGVSWMNILSSVPKPTQVETIQTEENPLTIQPVEKLILEEEVPRIPKNKETDTPIQPTPSKKVRIQALVEKTQKTEHTSSLTASVIASNTSLFDSITSKITLFITKIISFFTTMTHRVLIAFYN